jgi:membrane fusion protein, macrolide-specific efflux system
MKKSKSKRWFAVLVLVAASAAGGWWYMGKDKEVEAQPLLATVRMGSIENTISASGSLKPRIFVDVGAQVSGLLEKLHVEVGDQVEAGDLLAEIDARVQIERVNSSRANLESQRAQLEARISALELARINAARQDRLRADEATSALEYDTAMNNLATAEANLVQVQKQIEQGEASLKTEETQLEFTRIFAPLTGTVTNIAMNEGRTLNAAQQAPIILTIADLGTMTVQTQISEADIGKVKQGMDVYFTTLGNGDRRWYSKVRQILPTPVVQNNVVLYTGLFDIENSDATLLPEMTTQVYFVSSSAQNVLVVPMGALSFIENKQDEPRGPGGPGGAMAAAGGGSGAPDPSQFQQMAASGQMPEITPEIRERMRQMRESGNMPAGFPGAAGGGGPGQGFGSARLTQPGERNLAKVTVVKDDGTREEREVIIGLTSRVNAEVISGLRPGEQVIAGIAQSQARPAATTTQPNVNFRQQQFMRF